MGAFTCGRYDLTSTLAKNSTCLAAVSGDTDSRSSLENQRCISIGPVGYRTSASALLARPQFWRISSAMLRTFSGLMSSPHGYGDDSTSRETRCGCRAA